MRDRIFYINPTASPLFRMIGAEIPLSEMTDQTTLQIILKVRLDFKLSPVTTKCFIEKSNTLPQVFLSLFGIFVAHHNPNKKLINFHFKVSNDFKHVITSTRFKFDKKYKKIIK
ncbi:hypothetical protein BpHYR1_015499 [Brachionus plicatilis]|uniref:Uncharacterized protein n=1 Tax=Brachionus plicatilis TaxID=10195 RepID=A0A3M7RB15_BRAPC|nr:hypothetical protein BpHYR1_015499 [Brachionus plicatilis]